MSNRLRKPAPIYLIGVILVMGIIYTLLTRTPRTGPAPELPAPDPRLASLGAPPDWTLLSKYDGVLSRVEFERALENIYLLGENLHF